MKNGHYKIFFADYNKMYFYTPFFWITVSLLFGFVGSLGLKLLEKNYCRIKYRKNGIEIKLSIKEK